MKALSCRWGFRLLLLFGLALARPSIAQPFVWTPASFPTTFPDGTSWADYDADGDLDLLAYDLVDVSVWEPRLYRNDGSGVFARVELPPARSSYPGTAHFWADDDRDGRLDLLLAGSDEAGQAVMRLFHALAGAGFSDARVGLEGEPGLWADLDNDGDLDIVASSRYGTGDFRVYWKQGTNYVQTTPASLPPPGHAGTYIDTAAAADVDGDGDVDLYLAAPYGAPARLLRNDGNGAFVDTGLSFPAVLKATAPWLDADADGDLELLLAQRDSGGTLATRLFAQDEPWQFTLQTSGLLPASRLRSADFDQDGDADVVGTSATGLGIRLQLNDGSGHYFDGGALSPPVGGGDLDVVDLDGDGDVDLLIAGADSPDGTVPTRRWYRNDHQPAGIGPDPPTNLAAETLGNRVILRWTRAGSGTTTNLRVGTQPGRSDIVSPLATDSGRRLVCAMGNAQTSSRWYLKGLAPGTYYWSAQAVDASFRGSAFAPETSFEVPVAPEPLPPPTLSPVPHQFLDEDAATSPIALVIGPESSLPNLSVTAESSNPALIAPNALRLLGEGVNRTLILAPTANQSGTSLITVRVTDAADQSASATFLLTVNPINDPPALEPIPHQITYLNAPPIEVPFEAADVDSTLTLTALSSNPDLLPASGLQVVRGWLTGAQALVITPATNRTGSAVVTLTASDGAAAASTSFVVSVLPPPFVPTTDRLTNFTQGSAGWADLDGDGDLDLLLTGSPTAFWSGTVRCYRNSGNGRVVDTGLDLVGVQRSISSLVDFDRDGDVDVVLAGVGTAEILQNDGAANFTVLTNVPNLLPVLAAGAAAVWGDLDNDGDLDLAYSQSSNELGILVNSNGMFVASGSLPRVAGYVAWGDGDSDGWLDLAFSGTNPSGAVTNGIWRGLGNAQFELSVQPLDQAVVGPVGWGDLNGDSRLDFWHLEFATTNRQLRLYPNLGGGRLGPAIVLPLAFVSPASFRWADFDNDGDLDFLVEVELPSVGPSPFQRDNRGLTIYRNDGDFRFTPLGNLLPQAEARFISVADVDNDGDVDLTAVVVGATSGIGVAVPNIRVLQNQVSAPNTPPGAPTGLQGRVEGQSVWLSWRPATDFNQPGALTYNVRAGTQPGASDLVSAMARPDGVRLVVGPGNAEARTISLLTNLTAETVYWSVQAVDHGYRGGPFAPEQRLVIDRPGNQPPELGEMADQNLEEETARVVPFTVHDDRTPPEQLRLWAYAENPFLLPAAGLTVAGGGTNRTLTLKPATNQTGQTTVTLLAIDAVGATGTRRFLVTVSNVNDPPYISPIADLTNLYSADPFEVTFSIGDPETPADQLLLRAESTNPAVVPVTNIVFSGTGATRTASLRTGAALEGQTTITFTVTDPDGAPASASFQLTVCSQVFRLLPALFGGVRSGSMAWGDLDGDGDLDLALAGQGLNQTALYRNDGENRFVKTDTDLPNVDGGGVEWADFDNDGDLDLLIHGRNLSGGDWVIANLYRNAGDGTLTLIQSGLNGRYGPAAWGDYDNDGRPDLVSTGDGSDGVPRAVVYHNEADGHFVARSPALEARGKAQLTASGVDSLWQDVDSDGTLELVLSRNPGLGWHDAVYRHADEGGFAEVAVPWVGSLLAVADLDGDNVTDLLESVGGQGDLRVLLGLGSGSLAPWGESILTNFGLDAAALGDFDNDGRLDLLCSGYTGNFEYVTRLFRNRGDGAWEPIEALLPDFIFGSASWADCDNDGDLDLLVNGQRDLPPLQGYSTLLYRNDQLTSNSPPSAPTDLRAFFTTNTVILAWQAATDPNQAGGLTYNLRVGTTQGGLDVVSPMSRADGRRLVPRPGNAGWLTRKLVRGLQRGRTYYWSVQAVDSSYTGSPFAAEASLALGEVPALEELTAQTIDEDGALSLPLHLSDPDGEVGAATVTVSLSDPPAWSGTSVTVTGGGAERTLTLRPGVDRNGTTTVTVTVLDAEGGMASRTFVLTVQPLNDAPRATDQALVVAEDGTLTFALSAWDPDGDPLSYELVRPPFRGVLSGAAPTLAYRPQTNFFGNDGCEFRVVDPQGAAVIERIGFRVTPTPDVEVARLSVRMLSDRTPFFRLEGEPWQAYVIEASEELHDWAAWDTLVSPDGVIEFIGPAPQPGLARFYRARTP